MAFQSLYRRYRPGTFDELVGQAHVSAALRNAVREGRVGHAYLFSGPRGTGKTSTARILAKAVNCQKRGDDGEPCDACESCVDVTRGTSLDVVELDAASNNGVGEIRALLERVAFRTAGGERRIYIIDEVHMLSAGASNALLKTLEEPPEHIVFVLATTDPYKVLPTIRSRTQHFEFTLLSDDDLVAHLRSVLEREGVESDDEALAIVARRGAGSARDALSFLDQVLAHGGERLDAAAVEQVPGGCSADSRAAIVDALAEGDAAAALVALEALVASGVEPRQIGDDLLRHLRDTFLLAASRGSVAPQVTDHDRARLLEVGGRMGAAAVTRAIEVIGDAVVEMRRAPDPRLMLEVALVRLARPDLDRSVDALAERVARLERALAEGTTPAGTTTAGASAVEAERPRVAGGSRGARAAQEALRAATGAEVSAPRTAPTDPTSEPPEPAPAGSASTSTEAREGAGPATALEVDDVILAWPAVLAQMTPRLRAMAQEAHPRRVDGDTVVLGLPDRYAKVHKATIEKEHGTIGDLLRAEVGHSVRLRVELESGAAPDARGQEPRARDDDVVGDVGAEATPPAMPPAAMPPPPHPEDAGEISDPTGAPESTLDSVERMLSETFDARIEDDDSP